MDTVRLECVPPHQQAAAQARLWREPYLYDGKGCWGYDPDDYESHSLQERADLNLRIVYPSGVDIPFAFIHTIWLTPTRPFLATGCQMLTACERLGIDPTTVFSAPEDRIHGTALFCWSEDDDGVLNDWWMVQPQTLPSYAGLR